MFENRVIKKMGPARPLVLRMSPEMTVWVVGTEEGKGDKLISFPVGS